MVAKTEAKVAKKSGPKGPVVLAKINTEARKNIDMKVGDTVKVHQKIVEKGKTRTQVFEGMLLARKHGNEAGATFTVRKNALGYGVERIFPLYSPNIEKVEVTRRAKVRRAKLYYIRDKAAKEVSKRMKMTMMRGGAQDLKYVEAVEAPAEAVESTEAK